MSSDDIFFFSFSFSFEKNILNLIASGFFLMSTLFSPFDCHKSNSNVFLFSLFETSKLIDNNGVLQHIIVGMISGWFWRFAVDL